MQLRRLLLMPLESIAQHPVLGATLPAAEAVFDRRVSGRRGARAVSVL